MSVETAAGRAAGFDELCALPRVSRVTEREDRMEREGRRDQEDLFTEPESTSTEIAFS